MPYQRIRPFVQTHFILGTVGVAHAGLPTSEMTEYSCGAYTCTNFTTLTSSERRCFKARCIDNYFYPELVFRKLDSKTDCEQDEGEGLCVNRSLVPDAIKVKVICNAYLEQGGGS